MAASFRDEIVDLIPKLRAYAVGLSGRVDDADDLVQDALIRAWRSQDTFTPGTSLKAWSFRILRNAWLDQLPSRRALVQDVDGHHAGQLSCAPSQEWSLRYGELLAAMQRLPKESRDSLLLVVGMGLSYAEAAEVCSCQVNAMKQRVHRARLQLAKLTAFDDDPAAAKTRRRPLVRNAFASAAVVAAVTLTAAVAQAQAQAAPPAQLSRIEAQLADQSRRLAEQEAKLEAQARLIAEQRARLENLEPVRTADLASLSGAGAAAPAPPAAPRVGQEMGAPVVEAREVAALPPNLGVLTPPGQLVLDPSIEYVSSSNNRLVFRGVEIIPGLQLGLIEASEAARNTSVATLAARFGLTGRLEVEGRVPYVYRSDNIVLLAREDPGFDRFRDPEAHSLGDVEVGARYQLNQGRGGWPIFVANSRVKAPTGVSPYEVPYDEFGVATGLSTGSGFWAAEGGVTLLYPTEPAILFGGLTYLHSFARDIDREIGGVQVSRVAPGASIGAQAGFGLSLNPRFSVSFGYSHAYVRPTRTWIGDTVQRSRALQVGSLQMGWSFRLSQKVTLNNSFEFGVTEDAPDLRVVLRTPFRF